jgi:CRP-like cAMP-binding protein
MSKLPARIVTRSLSPGETLLKPAEKIKSVYMIQSGRISLCQARNGKIVEVAQLSAGHSLGDEAAFGPFPWSLTALALRDTVVIEVPLEYVTEPLNLAPPSLKLLIKALGERLKTSFNEVKTLKLNREVAPCPADQVAKVFGVTYHVALMIGEVTLNDQGQKSRAKANWDEFKKFAYEVFDESVVRLEDAVNILVKLGYARFDGKDIFFHDLKQLEAFFDYYGGYHFRGGYDDLLKTNAKML